ncbi:MAG: Polysaccharide biosynthesis protein [Methanocella sp. PtaU1.Bin125]|nr:MAG: Polysaccharide biosynthesis protein [Methanocella sp. PtaU1.Bin125]
MSATSTYTSRLRNQPGIQLFKNSFFIIMNKMLAAGTGFVFWLLAARFYSVGDVGVATALISSAGLIMQFSYFGFDYSIIRFFSKYDRSKIFNTCTILIVSSALVLGTIFLAFVPYFSPELSFIQTPVYGAIFLLYIVVVTIAQVGAVTFIAARKAEFSFLQNLLLTLRLPLLIPLAFLGAFGILTSIGIAYVAVCLVVLAMISRLVRLRLAVDMAFVRQSLRFSSGNYVAQILLNITYLLLPLMILNVLGSSESAKYYIAFTIGNFLLQVPDAVSTSLFVEGSHGESMRKNVIRAASAIYAILIPGVAFIYFFGPQLLALFGKDYVESIELLRLFAFTSLFFAIYCLMVPIQNVRMNVKRIIRVNFIIFLLFMGMSYLLMTQMGIVGVGYALMITYIIVDIIILGLAKLEGWI